MANVREQWSGGWGFILAAAGSAIGLGNIWKFPYITGENGGGAFVLIYLLCIAAIGLPVMLCEMALGRHTQRNPVGAFKMLNPASCRVAHGVGAAICIGGLFLLAFKWWGWGVVALCLGMAIFRWRWVVVGVMGVAAGFIILAFYSVVGGWTIGYIVLAASGRLNFADVAAADAAFVSFAGHPAWAIGCHAVFMALCIGIVYKGVRAGIERWSKILMPLMFVLLLVLILRGLTLPGARAGVQFYLNPDFSRITAQSVLIALGHAFFSLSLGMGAIITYGSYLGKQQNLFAAGLSVVILDTAVALLAGLAIFPAVFAQGFSPDAGTGLVFKVIPAVFFHVPLGAFWAVLFFLLLAVAALTSGVSLLEVVTAYFVDERGWTRARAAAAVGAGIFGMGCLCAISLNDWTRLAWLHTVLLKVFGSVKGSFFDMLDHTASNWMLPLGGFFITIFVGWIWSARRAAAEIRQGGENYADASMVQLLAGLNEPGDRGAVTPLTLWGIFIRFVSPAAVLIAFLHTIGWLTFASAPPAAPRPGPPAAAADAAPDAGPATAR